MSSHREAPEISKDPVADSTDVYAFVSPDKPGHGHADRQLHPAAGPGRRPELLLVRRRRPVRDPHRQRRRRPGRHHLPVPLQDHGCGTPTRSSTTSARSVARQPELEQPPVLLRSPGSSTARAPHARQNLPCPPCNIGPLSTPHYADPRQRGGARARRRHRVFAGQRAEGFYVDLGSIFDLGDLRPFEELHAQYGMHVFSKPARRRQRHRRLNVHSIAIQVPTRDLTAGQAPASPTPASVIGVWTTASRQQVTLWDAAAARTQQRPVHARSRGWATRSSTRS